MPNVDHEPSKQRLVLFATAGAVLFGSGVVIGGKVLLDANSKAAPVAAIDEIEGGFAPSSATALKEQGVIIPEYTPVPSLIIQEKPVPTATVTASPTTKPTETTTPTVTAPAKPTREPTPAKVVRNTETHSLYEPGPSPVWSDKTWDGIRKEVDDKFLSTSPVDPIDSEGNPVKMEIQLQRNDDKDPEKITGIGYTFPELTQGTKVRAVISGVVENIFDMSDTKTPQKVGSMVYIRHASGGIAVLYIHGKEPLLIQKGMSIKQGEIIGEIGDPNLPHIMPWDLDVIFAPTPNREDQPAYIASYQKYWYTWPPVSAPPSATK